MVGGLLQACSSPAPAASPAAVPSVASAPASGAATAAPAQPQSALAPTAADGAAASAPADWQQQFDALQTAAKQEGNLTVITPPGDIYRTFANVFQEKYGIQVELLVANGQADLQPKIDAERKAGQYNYDVITHSPGVMLQGLVPIGAMAELAPALILPEVLDDSKWFKGFQYGWADLNQTSCYGFVGYAATTARVNRSIVPESQLGTLDQLWDPQWSGKIAIFDPRIGGSGLQAVTVWLVTLGEDRLRQFFTQQKPIPTQDRRQIGQWVVEGEYPIGVGLSLDGLSPLAAQGADVSSVQPLDLPNPNGTYMSLGSGSLGLIDRAPHPNAAKLFANWVLTQEGVAQWGQVVNYDTRR